MKRHYNTALTALILVRLGQELGTDCPATRSLHDLLDFLLSVANIFPR